MRIIIYARVSTTDMKNSIENQLSIGRQWVEENCLIDNYNIGDSRVKIEEVIDRGYSGSNMDRPGIKHIIEMVEECKRKSRKYSTMINLIVVKDVSRLGRNYIEVGLFIRKLQEKGIRLVCVNKKEDDMNLNDIDNILSDFYSKDISIKTKSVLDMNKRKGIYSIAKVPFGYRKSREDKYEIVIYEPEASIVRFIYDRYNKGDSVKDIVIKLNNREVELNNEVIGANRSSKNNQQKEWNYQKVYSILNNEFYKGTMVYGKTKGHIWEGKKRVYLDKKDWIRIENHHDAII